MLDRLNIGRRCWSAQNDALAGRACLPEEYDFFCELSVSRKGNMLVFKDEGGQCSGGVFFCGARIGLNGIESPKVDGECPTEKQ